jgi:transcriptional regulator with XRE-family HTH domain
MGKASRARPEKLAEKLTAIRESLGLTHEELISRLDCPQIPLYRASISQYESGKSEPPLPVLLRYARLAGITIDVLADDETELSDYFPSIAFS